MQFKKTILRLFLILFPAFSFSQTTYLPFGDKQYTLLERMEIKAGTDSILNFSKTRPFSRKSIFFKEINVYNLVNHPGTSDVALAGDSSLAQRMALSKVDRYNLRSAVLNNQEWIGNAPGGVRPPEFAS